MKIIRYFSGQRSGRKFIIPHKLPLHIEIGKREFAEKIFLFASHDVVHDESFTNRDFPALQHFGDSVHSVVPFESENFKF